MIKDDDGVFAVFSGKQARAEAARVLGVNRETYAYVILDAIERSDHALHDRAIETLGKYRPFLG